ncbi:MAG: transaldolase [Rhodospirillales bacterium]|nr:transaldolase [Rhodospirillales bacterium]
MTALANIKVKIFADGADLDSMKAMYQNPLIKGFTTNPTLMRKDGVTDYESFARDVIKAIPDRPLSFEVFADDESGMERQALEIASWGSNVNVKIPVTNTKGKFMGDVIRRLSAAGVIVNVTAVMALDQVRRIADSLDEKTAAIVSVFAGRIADTGVDPLPVMTEAVDILKSKPKAELLWASPRELLNIFHAEEIGCHIITVTTGRSKAPARRLWRYFSYSSSRLPVRRESRAPFPDEMPGPHFRPGSAPAVRASDSEVPEPPLRKSQG